MSSFAPTPRTRRANGRGWRVSSALVVGCAATALAFGGSETTRAIGVDVDVVSGVARALSMPFAVVSFADASRVVSRRHTGRYDRRRAVEQTKRRFSKFLRHRPGEGGGEDDGDDKDDDDDDDDDEDDNDEGCGSDKRGKKLDEAACKKREEREKKQREREESDEDYGFGSLFEDITDGDAAEADGGGSSPEDADDE
ncbi:unnamed product [Ostreococcus tauri]|uniref:Unnamed product n=1 Tax=Ostreococcus tauri TaxID=70448 RepID=A0A090MDQ0_OSTTA|nr:unnamed product [Ostreococcus tauri]CEG01061.1 unnamed product [Ostreococcus tauri]|eukprot:XP_003075117.2 unnamed product [Ostreococcus tauri]